MCDVDCAALLPKNKGEEKAKSESEIGAKIFGSSPGKIPWLRSRAWVKFQESRWVKVWFFYNIPFRRFGIPGMFSACLARSAEMRHCERRLTLSFRKEGRFLKFPNGLRQRERRYGGIVGRVTSERKWSN
jgi:hypothetical protein